MGVEKEVLTAGTGPKPVSGQRVTVHFTGFGKNGDLSQKFWSTKDPGQQPFTFKIGRGLVIKGQRVCESPVPISLPRTEQIHFPGHRDQNSYSGWDEGVMVMHIGDVARLRCSPDYAYDCHGFPAWGIQPDSVLVFEIEVLSVK